MSSLDSDTQTVQCVECGKDLTDPKNCGDPDINGEWVCTDAPCRVVHETAMTVHRTVIETDSAHPRGQQ